MARKRLDLCVAFLVALVALVALVSVVLFGRTASAGASLPELAAKANPSVVLLTISDSGDRKLGTGTGWFVSTTGRVVTNHHVIEDASKVTATLSDGRKIDATGLLASDAETDVAILQFPGEDYPALSLGESKSLRMGDEIVVIGSPRGLSGTLSTGIVSALRDPHALDDTGGDGRYGSWRIQITAAISPGSSGSPIMSLSGQVVAVAVGQRLGGEGLGFGIPIEEVKTLLDGITARGAKLEPFARAGMSSVRKNLLISAAFFGGLAILYFAFKRYDGRRRKGSERKRTLPS